jgi:hypothetical protein
MPWTEIFRAFQLALDPSKLALALVAVVLLWAGWGFLGWALLPETKDNVYGTWPPDAKRGRNPFDTLGATVSGIVPNQPTPTAGTDAATKPADTPAKPTDKDTKEAKAPILPTKPPEAGEGGVFTKDFWLGNDYSQGPVQLEPFHKILGPIHDLLHSQPIGPGWQRWWYAFLGLIFSLAVWGLFAGAITRIAAVQYARKEKLGISEAIRFARSKYKSFLIAPLLPLAGIIIMVVLMFLGSLLIHIPWVGVILASLLWFLPLLAGIIIVIAVLAYLGWPIMYATISTEGSDSFDAISRSLAYVWQRPAHYFFYFLVSTLYGILVTFVVVFVVTFVVHAARWGVGSVEPQFSWYYDEDKNPPVRSMFVYAPESYHWRDILTGTSQLREDERRLTWERWRNNMDWAQTAAAGIMAAWMHIIFLLVVAFAYSYFWCSGTIVYFLMRKKVDDTDLDEVYLEEEEPFVTEMTAPPATAPATLPMVSSEPAKASAPVTTEAPKPSEPVSTAKPSGDGVETKPAGTADKKEGTATSESKP